MRRQKVISLILLQLFICSIHSYVNPVQSVSDSPDPGVIRNVDGFYYAATTGGSNGMKFPIWKSKDLGSWTKVGYAFQSTPSWTDGGDFWAPQIHIVGKKYNVYYTARTHSHKLCIGVAYSDHILGPYIDIGEPLWQQEDLGIIDATFYKSQDKNYLIYKTDGNAVRQPTQFYAVELSADGHKVIGQRVFLLKNTLPFEAGIIQAPWVIFQNNYFYMFYSACGYANKCYSVGVARSRKLLGPYQKSGSPILYTKASEDQKSMEGPGHCSVVKGVNNNWAMVYHAWPHGAIGTKRLMLLDKVRWTADQWPAVGAPSETETPLP